MHCCTAVQQRYWISRLAADSTAVSRAHLQCLGDCLTQKSDFNQKYTLKLTLSEPHSGFGLETNWLEIRRVR